MNTLYLRQSHLQGIVGGRQVSCSFRTSPGGLSIPAGEYMLLPAVNNPLHGAVMSLVPSSGEGVQSPALGGLLASGASHEGIKGNPQMPAGMKFDQGASAGIKSAPQMPAGMKFDQGASAVKIKLGSGASHEGIKGNPQMPAGVKFDRGASAGIKSAPQMPGGHKVDPGASARYFKVSAGEPTMALAVAGKQIGGTNALIVDQGFSELVDAVAKSGGIRVIVS